MVRLFRRTPTARGRRGIERQGRIIDERIGGALAAGRGRSRSDGGAGEALGDEGRAATTLVGRRVELAQILDAVDAGRSGPRAMLLLGEAGTGKTALLAAAARHGREVGSLVLSARGCAAEAEQPFAVLHQLLVPLLPKAGDLPGHQRQALEAAFGVVPATPGHDRKSLRVAVLNLLAGVSRHRPVLLIVDDVRHVDRDSLDVLGFAMRRLTTEAVTVLLAARGHTAPEVPDLPVLSLAPLSRREAARLLDAQPEPPAGRARIDLLEQAAGNPLAIIELCRAAREAPTGGGPPQTLRIQEMFADRSRALPAATQRLILYAAASPDQENLQTIMAAAGAGADLGMWAPAEDAGLIGISGGRVGFRHPLVRTAAYDGAPAHLRQRAHTDLAAVLGAEPERRAWHLAAARTGTDESVAAALEDTAELAGRRGGFFATARALERSAECSPDPRDRARRYAKAIRAVQNAGDPSWARELYGKVAALTRDPGPLGVAACGAGTALSLFGRQREAFEALTRHPPADGTTSLSLAAAAGAVAYQSGLPEMRRSLPGLLDRTERKDGDTPDADSSYAGLTEAGAADAVRAVVLAEADPVTHAPPLLRRLGRRRKPARPPTGLAETARLHAIAAIAWLADETDLCVTTFRQAYDLLRVHGSIGVGARSFVPMASALVDSGRWTEADELLEEAATLAAVHQWSHVQVDVAALRATLRGLRGRTGGEPPDDPVWTAVGLEENRATRAHLLRAAGTAAMAAGDLDEAFRHFRRLFDEDGVPAHYFLSPRSVVDLALVAQRTGRREEAAPVLAAVRDAVGDRPTSRMTLLLHHAAALAGAPRDAEHHFRLAAVNPAGDQWPVARAQARLHYAQWLRRKRRPLEARPLLSAALETFVRLGAEGLADEARGELRASGVAASPSRADPLSGLTAQQQQIVRLAARGLRNREIAEQLMLSPRTVSSHLYNVYPKLGVSSRHQLRDLFEDR
ncbi:ATP-binding protein [Actinoallomurus iriomotensis]|uniref:Transcriptional regulator n=1 Tax=Actinoallomurus iriomotensis TaxID=478107 RepID=A0A9W6VZI9_9ACTN|nr:AAA family ATPase [Actinoallomurus iriomotensis]GLY85940.1 transcriptional regulator [Actinoallomurus iriomotensis]